MDTQTHSHMHTYECVYMPRKITTASSASDMHTHTHIHARTHIHMFRLLKTAITSSSASDIHTHIYAYTYTHTYVQAAEDSNNSFFSKWAGSKIKTATAHGKKAPLSDSDMKLYVRYAILVYMRACIFLCLYIHMHICGNAS